MTEATGIEAKTIHRLLEFHPFGGGFNAATPPRSSVICWSSTRPPWST